MPIIFVAISLCLLLAPPPAFSGDTGQQRPLFLQAEQAIMQGRPAEAESLLPQLADYPLLPYLLYQQLKRNLDNGPALEEFLNRHGDTRLAKLLRQQWLERLAAQGAWADYARHYTDSDSPKLQCGYFLALANLGRREEAFAGAARLWPSGASLPDDCERLFKLWQAEPGFTTGHVWTRYALAMQKGNLGLADGLRGLLPEPLRPQADFWRQVHADPKIVLSCAGWDNPQDPITGRIFAHGIDRLASADPLAAQTAWALQKNRFAIAPEESAQIDRRTALALAAQRYNQTGAYLSEIPSENADAQIRGWRVRAALTRQDWPGALAAIASLPAEEQSQAQWRYWRGRGLEALGDQQGAAEHYRLAAQERDFYGFNAADHIGAEYPLASQAVPVGEDELARLAERPPFPAIRELLALNRDGEARGEWLYAIKALSPRDLLAAAKLAQQWGLDNLAISTVAKAGYWDDLALRFPLAYQDLVVQTASAQQLEPARVYAVIRRESAFDPNIGSAAGALGLMQLMPSTGELMARRFNEKLPSAAALLAPARNLRYGSAYLRGLLERFGNHFALAAAAYNAGPNRVDRWLPADHAWPADVWVETIPYSETRQYVAAVLSHEVVYRARLNQAPQRIGALLPAVATGPKAEAKPDRPIPLPVCD